MVKSFLGNFYRHLAIFFWSHWWHQFLIFSALSIKINVYNIDLPCCFHSSSWKRSGSCGKVWPRFNIWWTSLASLIQFALTSGINTVKVFRWETYKSSAGTYLVRLVWMPISSILLKMIAIPTKQSQVDQARSFYKVDNIIIFYKMIKLIFKFLPFLCTL